MALAAREYVLSGDQIPDIQAANANPSVIVPVDSELMGVYGHNNVLIGTGGAGAPVVFTIHKNATTTGFDFKVPELTADEAVAFYPLNGKVFFVAGEACTAESDAAQVLAGDLHLSFLFRRL